MSAFQKWLVLSSAVLTTVTGVVYWWMQHMLDPVDPWAVINHPLQPLVLKLHIVAAPVLVFGLGTIALDHVWKHLRTSIRLGRRSGVTAMAVVLPMVASGYLIQAVTDTTLLRAMVWIHLGTGGVFAVGLALHQAVISRRRRARARLGGGRWEAIGRLARRLPPEGG